jgi:seryl-tRNA synthetase
VNTAQRPGGIVRVYQFNKVEMVNFVRPDASEERFKGLVSEAEAVLRRLKLPLPCPRDVYG